VNYLESHPIVGVIEPLVSLIIPRIDPAWSNCGDEGFAFAEACFEYSRKLAAGVHVHINEDVPFPKLSTKILGDSEP
jgi:hypothetical protein